MLAEAVDVFATQPDTAAARALLKALRTTLTAADPALAAQAIVDFLGSGVDAATGLPFTPQPDGTLDSVPSVRSALLDLLPALDPDLALEQARLSMDMAQSADEYALGLRNLAWSDFEGDRAEELKTRFLNMLAVPVWREQPPQAFLAAFDIAVHLAEPVTARAMADLFALASTSPALEHAAFVALDRIAVRAPEVLVELYRSDPAFLAAAPNQRASLLSRLDLRQGDQRAVLLDYFARADLAADELDYFTALYPNANFVHTNRLLSTPDDTPSITARGELDRALSEEIARLRLEVTDAAQQRVLSRISARLPGEERP